MKFRHELAYDAPPSAVFEMLADPEFRRAVGAAQDVVSADVAVERSGSGLTVTVDQVQRTGELPAFARAFAGETTRAVQREVWADQSGATLRIEAPGTPSEVTGSISLQPDGSGTREVVELDLRIKVPLVGGKLEKLLAERIAAGMDAEHAVGVSYLKGK